MNSISPFAYIIQPLIALGILLNIAFLINYGLRSKWRSTSGGQLFFYAFSLTTALLMLNGASYFFEAYPGREAVRIAVYSLLALNAVGANIVLVRRQRENSHAVVEFARTIDPTLAKKSDAELRQIVAGWKKQYRADPVGFTLQAPVVDTDK